jgi:hypothetical protein
MHEGLPQLALLFGRSPHLAALNASEKLTRQLTLAGMILSVHRAEIEKLVAQSISFALLRKNIRQRKREFAQTLRLRPRLFVIEGGGREQPFAAPCAFVQAGKELIAEGSRQSLQRI